MTEYTVSMTFETAVNAENDKIAEQAARKRARSIDRDSANKHVDLASVNVEVSEE